MWLSHRRLHLAGPSHNKRPWYSSAAQCTGALEQNTYLKYNTYETNSKGTTDSAEHPADLRSLWISPRRTEPPAGLSPCPCSAAHRDLLQSPSSVKCGMNSAHFQQGRDRESKRQHTKGENHFFFPSTTSGFCDYPHGIQYIINLKSYYTERVGMYSWERFKISTSKLLIR